ncbi:cobaltochelatase subunit CobN [Oxynema sp. CENA135]|uniref:cobaltochelatase subunit CobN n=1 Tax=Oxynema sp. CENA135 TaxID=984206 RepID=UPI00190B0A42|nr:cobaltochelatase subunit CobN [Oxynema sp. CENA135]MBK4729230.1 cobaltochelatase subunit CobN [Oxynema sp. CENA135]
MHRLAVTPGGWNPEEEGVVFIDQTPAPLVFLTAADTDIQVLAQAVDRLPSDFPALRVVNLLQLQQHLSIDTYASEVLSQARAIVLRLLGGRAYWSYGLEVLRETARSHDIHLIVLPGDDAEDPELIGHSNVPLATVNRVWRYLSEGGIENAVNGLKYIADTCLQGKHAPPPPVTVPRVGRYSPRGIDGDPESARGTVGILFYRAHYLAGNTAPVDALCRALAERHLKAVPLFVSSLRDRDVRAQVCAAFEPDDGDRVQLIINTTGFAIDSDHLQRQTCGLTPNFWQKLDVPVLQAICSSDNRDRWTSGFQGLSPRDMAMNVALPEVDGRIITRAISFKAVQGDNEALETPVVVYEPCGDRVDFVAELGANWVKLRQTPASERKIALILANYPTKDGRLANGVGLDTPASCIAILKALHAAGYRVDRVPETGEELIRRLTEGVTNDPEGRDFRAIAQSVSVQEYRKYFETLPDSVRRGVGDRWGDSELVEGAEIPIAGIQLGNVFVGIQPARGYDRDPSLNYHAPDLEPTHAYLAFYYWLRERFGVGAIAHVGKHGNLEWLPGKSVALSQTCYPEVALGAIPHFYPFIVNDPGEGSQAKRRSHAVILDHLTPPMTRAELYGPMQQLEGAIDEYYEAQSLDPSRLSEIRDRIAALVRREHLDTDLGAIAPTEAKLGQDDGAFAQFLQSADGYLCELKEAQIRDGLHVFGHCPQGRQLRDLAVAIARCPGPDRLGLTRAIARDWDLDVDPLTADLSEAIDPSDLPPFLAKPHVSVGDLVEAIEEFAARCVEQAEVGDRDPNLGTATARELDWIEGFLLPALRQCDRELHQLLRGFDGRYIPSGPSGAPTRGRPDVLPTGRNFYSVDIRAIPTETAWDLGRRAADAAIERYTQDCGDYPKTLGLSVWGTSTMRTGGDDIAEALALLGVRPVWDGMSRRVVDFEILPVRSLGRPRVDVTLRISGFFRDAFPNLIDLFDRAVAAVANLDESEEDNPLAAQVRREREKWEALGLNEREAIARSRYRVFGSKPGAYGAGLQGLIEDRNWTDDSDLARAYLNWSSYAYTGYGKGHSAPEAFEKRLGQMQIVLHNQDNREHDLLDSDDYYQFQGGLTAAVRSIKGENPVTYFGDHSRSQQPKIRQLREEMARVYRSRVVNPKWIAGVMRHGYKGAFEMAATLDYLFAYDATANCVEDFMYEGIANAYLFDEQVEKFIAEHNPWALRDMAERLLEAHQRGLWQGVEGSVLDRLQAIALHAEAAIESTMI